MCTVIRVHFRVPEGWEFVVGRDLVCGYKDSPRFVGPDWSFRRENRGHPLHWGEPLTTDDPASVTCLRCRKHQIWIQEYYKQKRFQMWKAHFGILAEVHEKII
jgi:hypothetical protein